MRDYRIHSSRDKAIITGGSAFNVKAESLHLGNFNRPEIEALLQQHTAETGQVFKPAAVAQLWQLTQGQPWLVNALAYETCFKMETGQDRAAPITAGMVTQAKERLILRWETHLDQLADKLQETRVRQVVEPILAGDTGPDLIPTDDIGYVRDLGLIRTDQGQLAIANPIYQEVIPREQRHRGRASGHLWPQRGTQLGGEAVQPGRAVPGQGHQGVGNVIPMQKASGRMLFNSADNWSYPNQR